MVFGFGILMQTIFILGRDLLNVKNIRELTRDILGAIFSTFLLAFIWLRYDGSYNSLGWDLVLLLIYFFYLIFCACFGMSFKRKILSETNEISLILIHTLVICYFVTRFGVVFVFTLATYPFFVFSILTLFKKDLGNVWKGWAYALYIFIFMFLGLSNLFQLWIFYMHNIPSVVVFMMGTVFFNTITYFGILTELIGYDENYKVGRQKSMSKLLTLSIYFYKTNINSFIVLMGALIFALIFVVNYREHYFSESLLVLFVLSVIPLFNRLVAKRNKELL